MKLAIYYRLYHFFGRLETTFFRRWIAEYQRVNHLTPRG